MPMNSVNARRNSARISTNTTKASEKKSYSGWSRLIGGVRNLTAWPESLQKEGQLELETPSQRYEIHLDGENNVQVKAIALAAGMRMKKLQARAKEIKKHLENTPAKTHTDITREPVSYTGRDKHAVPEFKQSPQFAQFKQEYIDTVHAVRNLVSDCLKDENAGFEQFLDRVFPPAD